MPETRIITNPNPILRARAEAVKREEFGSKKLRDIIKNMAGALRATEDGIGIAAPQIGVSKRVFIASEEALAIDNDVDQELLKEKKGAWQYYTFINPEIKKISAKKSSGVEGCLSVPKKYGEVPRAQKVRVRARDENGKTFERGASGLFARLLQHEIDHLNGILFIDKAEKIIARDDTSKH